MSSSSLFICLLVVAVLAPSVFAWGAIGHAAIANTAWQLMNEKAKAAVYNYIPSNDTMTDIASLADQYAETPAGKWSAHLHYVNMNKGQTEFEMSVDCTNGCVVSAIMNDTAVLLNSDFLASLVAEPNALEFLVHFVGDVHQPLHVGWGYDEGGNAVTCYFMGKKTELHAVWDTGMIEYFNPSWYDWSMDLVKDIQQNASLITYYTQSMNATIWADESFAYVRNDVYNFYPTDSIAQPAGQEAPSLGDAYYKHNLPIVFERLTAASIRLATLLNTIFG
jgi:hypothetical protein